MWPFKKREKMTLEQYAATRPAAPCGEQTTHVEWTEIHGMPCPKCARIARDKKKDADESRMAEKIAAALIRQMAERSNVGLTTSSKTQSGVKE